MLRLSDLPTLFFSNLWSHCSPLSTDKVVFPDSGWQALLPPLIESNFTYFFHPCHLQPLA